MNDIERQIIQDLQDSEQKWVNRALLMSSVLRHLGYNTNNIMNGDKKVLAGYVGMDPADIVYCLQMGGGDGNL